MAIASERPELSVALDSLDGQPFGCGDFRNIVEGESAEISLIIGEPSAWGRGIGQEAMALLMDFGFTELGLTRIWLVVRAEHARAIRLFSGLAFTREEVRANALIVDGIPRDKWRMSIKKLILTDFLRGTSWGALTAAAGEAILGPWLGRVCNRPFTIGFGRMASCFASYACPARSTSSFIPCSATFVGTILSIFACSSW
jgi:hypothetical protein